METTDNYRKHTTKSSLQRILINNFLSTLCALAKTVDVESLLDVGCGEGFTLALLKRKNIAKKYEGIEYLDTAIELGKKLHPDILIKKGDIYDLPYKDNAFDIVVCTEVLEHLERPADALKELTRVTRKYCLLSVPHEPLFIGGNFIRGKNWSRWGNDIEHIQHWTHWGFEKFVKKAGLKIVKKKLPLPWTMILAEKVSTS